MAYFYSKLIFGNAGPGQDSFWSHLQGRPPTGSNFFIEVKNMYLHQDSKPGSLEYPYNHFKHFVVLTQKYIDVNMKLSLL